MHNHRRKVHYNNNNGHGFNLATVAQIFAIPTLTAGGLFFAQWITFGDTLKRHDAEIAAQVIARDTDKKEFGSKFDTMNSALAMLNTHAAVQDETLKQIRDQFVSYLQQQQHK